MAKRNSAMSNIRYVVWVSGEDRAVSWCEFSSKRQANAWLEVGLPTPSGLLYANDPEIVGVFTTREMQARGLLPKD